MQKLTQNQTAIETSYPLNDPGKPTQHLIFGFSHNTGLAGANMLSYETSLWYSVPNAEPTIR